MGKDGAKSGCPTPTMAAVEHGACLMQGCAAVDACLGPNRHHDR